MTLLQALTNYEEAYGNRVLLGAITATDKQIVQRISAHDAARREFLDALEQIIEDKIQARLLENNLREYK